MKDTALTPAAKAALAGKEVSEGSQKSVIKALAAKVLGTEAKLDKKEKNQRKVMEAVADVGHNAAHAAEAASAAFLGGLSEGYYGDKVRPHGVDVRGVMGLLGEGVGFYLTYKGSRAAGHVIAPSRALVSTAVASAGMRAGQAIRDNADKNKAPAPAQGQVQIPADAKPGDVIDVNTPEGLKKGTVVLQADGSLGVTFGASSDYRQVRLPPVMMSPGARRGGRRGNSARRGAAPPFPRPRA